jgi:hypothetical protein
MPSPLADAARGFFLIARKAYHVTSSAAFHPDSCNKVFRERKHFNFPLSETFGD